MSALAYVLVVLCLRSLIYLLGIMYEVFEQLNKCPCLCTWCFVSKMEDSSFKVFH